MSSSIVADRSMWPDGIDRDHAADDLLPMQVKQRNHQSYREEAHNRLAVLNVNQALPVDGLDGVRSVVTAPCARRKSAKIANGGHSSCDLASHGVSEGRERVAARASLSEAIGTRCLSMR